jgi:hypothetical protein
LLPHPCPDMAGWERHMGSIKAARSSNILRFIIL